MIFIHQMGKDMFPYNGREKNKMRLIRSVAVSHDDDDDDNKQKGEVKSVNRWHAQHMDHYLISVT
jgi:hypothetical protein